MIKLILSLIPLMESPYHSTIQYQFNRVISWDRVASISRAGGSCIKRTTNIIINNDTIHGNEKTIIKINISRNEKYSSNTLQHATYIIKNYGNLR